MKRVMIIAGEVSGDMHAANLAQAARERQPDIEWFGIGGPLMREAGVETLHDVSDMAVIGLAEVLKRYAFFKRVFNEMLALADERKPDAVVLVDYPGFNLRLAAKLHSRGIKVIYYVCPQVWAWHRERIPRMARIIDHLITIFPFEAKHFEETDLQVSFAGHPLVDEADLARSLPAVALPWKGRKRVALLPGSRAQEIMRLLPVMWEAASRLEKQNPDISFIIATPSEAEIPLVREAISGIVGPSNWDIVANQTRQVLRQADAAVVASGTATIETALMRCPMVVVYKVNPITYLLGRMLVKIPHIGMVNIVAGREVCRELIQWDANPRMLTDSLLPLVEDTPQRKRMLEALDQVAHALGGGGAAEQAAKIVLGELGNKAES
jgi:lipid-A-disaccharide synthase